MDSIMQSSPQEKAARRIPAWAENLRNQFLADECSQFLIHGNVYDLFPFRQEYLGLRDFLQKGLLAEKWVLFYNRSEGLVVSDPAGTVQEPAWLLGLASSCGSLLETESGARSVAADPDRVLPLLDRVLQTARGSSRNYAFVLDYAETILPETSMTFLSDGERKNLITVHRWADDLDLRLSNGVVLLIAETLADVNARIRSHPSINLIEIPFPDQEERQAFIESLIALLGSGLTLALAPQKLAEVTSGLSLTHIEKMIRSAWKQGTQLDYETVVRRKNSVIEKESGGLLEVVYPKHSVDDCAGHTLAKKRIRREIAKIKSEQRSKCPAGIILVGEMGTGKTYLTFAIAFEFGLPVVIIKNLLGSLVGLSDSNQEKMLSMLEAMAPIIVIVDEGDVFFGKRKSEGDSGVQSRQFGRYATFMSQGSHRGRVFWIINSAHPDNLADDFKRPGRCDVIIPLFPMLSQEDQKETLVKVFAQRGIDTTSFDWEKSLALLAETGSQGWPVREYTASDLSKIAVLAEDLAEERGAAAVQSEDLATALQQYSPGSIQLVKKYQRLLAITECTAAETVPEPYRSLPLEEVYRQIRELKIQLGDRI